MFINNTNDSINSSKMLSLTLIINVTNILVGDL